MSKQHLVLNALLPVSEACNDSLAAAIYQREQAALKEMPAALNSLPCDLLELKAFNIVGLDALRHLLHSHPVPQVAESDELTEELYAPPLSALVDEIAANGHGLIMLSSII